MGARQPRALRRAPAPLAGDDPIPVVRLADDDRLNDAVALDGARELVEARVVGPLARLVFVWREQIDVDFRGRQPRHGRVGNQRAESLAERRSLVHTHS